MRVRHGPSSHYQTKDGKWIAIACTSDAMFVRLAEVMEQPELASANRYSPQALRLGARDEVNAADILEDTQYRARRNIQMKESRAGAIAVPDDVVPRLSSMPGEIPWLGEGIGAQNEEIFRDLLGIQDDDLKQLRDDGVI